MTKADQILSEVYAKLGLTSQGSGVKYRRVNDIVTELATINAHSPISVMTTGTISERLCRLALEATIGDNFTRPPSNWKWLGDFTLLGSPFNVFVSVKSFKARERLIASGRSSVLAPTLGWGLFDDVMEWSADRTKSYLYAGFVAIYMPISTFAQISSAARGILNLNGNPFLRHLEQFIDDLERARAGELIDVRLV